MIYIYIYIQQYCRWIKPLSWLNALKISLKMKDSYTLNIIIIIIIIITVVIKFTPSVPLTLRCSANWFCHIVGGLFLSLFLKIYSGLYSLQFVLLTNFSNILKYFFSIILFFPNCVYWCRIHLWFRYVGGFVRQVDDVTAQPFQRTVTPARATP